MKILITGGAGFLGSHLCERLLKEGNEVVCVDNLITGSKHNILHLLREKKFKFLKHNITEPLNRIERAGITAIFHLASPASPKSYETYPLETMLVNSLGTYLMLELAKENKAKFLLASTSEVYGDPKEHPQKESYWGNVNPWGLRSCYDESKRFAEAMTMVYFRKYSLDVRIVRIFNTYGPRMQADDGRVVSNFVTQATGNLPLTVYGKGKQTRSLCYVADMIEGFIKAMWSEKTKGEVFNLGNPEEHSILEYAEIIRKLTESSSKIIFKPLPEDDPSRRRPDISKAKKLLGWEPRVSLREGLLKTIGYFKNL